MVRRTVARLLCVRGGQGVKSQSLKTSHDVLSPLIISWRDAQSTMAGSVGSECTAARNRSEYVPDELGEGLQEGAEGGGSRGRGSSTGVAGASEEWIVLDEDDEHGQT